MQIKTEEFLLPTHWACYFINGDESGYEDAELREITHWESICAPGPCLDVCSDDGFCRTGDDGGLACDRSTFVFQVLEECYSDGEVVKHV